MAIGILLVIIILLFQVFELTCNFHGSIERVCLYFYFLCIRKIIEMFVFPNMNLCKIREKAG